jgi:hypothetical protein
VAVEGLEYGHTMIAREYCSHWSAGETCGFCKPIVDTLSKILPPTE